ncbi:MAG: hypothetical protein GY797_38400 [Deltaproteobacteria bacterium]|nr:hypothetical protein [Deltaproteobacteria bacterium]
MKSTQVKLIKGEVEEEFLKDVQFIYNQWDDVEVLHYDHNLGNFKAVLVCRDREKSLRNH